MTKLIRPLENRLEKAMIKVPLKPFAACRIADVLAFAV